MRSRLQTETRLLSIIIKHAPLTAPELSRLTGYSRSWVWKTLRRMARNNIVRLEKRGGTLIVYPDRNSYKRLLRIGILRASEYPYILPFAKRLRILYPNVEIVVYDEAFRLAYDIALGRLHLGFAPAISHLIVHRISGGLTYIIGGGSRGGAGVIDGGRGSGHMTTMASTMELCAEIKKLEPPRIYARRGETILDSVLRGKARYGVLWEPYLYVAKTKGLHVDNCDLPFCCLLGGNVGLLSEYDKINKALFNAMEEAIRRIKDPVFIEAYASLTGLNRDLVANTFQSYQFIVEPPMNELQSLVAYMKDVAFPDWILDEAVI